MMKKGRKRFVSALLAVAMVLTGIGANTKTALANESTMQNYVYDGYEVTFMVTSAWDGAFNAEVKIANTGDEAINDWALEFDFDHEIQNMWNATVVEHSEDNYIVKNSDWNANIKPSEGVGFGMTVQCEGDITFPENFSFVMGEESVTAQCYSAEFILYSDWGTGCNGAIILSNLTDEPIENWQLEFDYDREIVNISNAVIVSYEQGHYVIKNAEYNADIVGNSSVHIGIVASEGAADECPENFTMQQTVVGDATTGAEGGNEEAPEEETPELSEEEKEAIIAERLKGVKYTEPAEEHIKYDEATDTCYVDNQILVVTKEGVTLKEAEAFADDFGAVVVGYIILTGDFQLEFTEVKTREELIVLVEKISTCELVEDVMLHEMFEMDLSGVSEWYDDEVEKAKWDKEWNTSFPNGANWGLEAIDAMGAWKYEGETVNVGIIDTVIDAEHEDLGLKNENVLLNSNRVVKNYEKASRDTYNDYAHGTHVAGTIAAKHNNDIGIEGVANNVELYAVANNGTNTVNETSLISYMRFKYALASLIFRECKVINVSMGTTSHDLEYEADLYGDYLSKLLRLGYDFVIVQAAGNDKEDARESGLFAWIEREDVKNRVIVVGAVGVRSTLGIIVDNYLGGLLGGEKYTVRGYEYWVESNYGERVDVCAPGVNIYSTLPGNRYSNIEWGEERWTGTSMAAPHVSGVAAMCYSVNPQLTGEQVKKIICENAVRYVTREADGSKYALVNAHLAVDAASKTEGNMSEIDIIETGAIIGRIYEYNTLEANVPSNESLEAKDVEVFFYSVSENDGLLKECADNIKATSDGTFSSILPVGIYSIVVCSEEYLPVLYTNVEVKEGQTEVVKISAYRVNDQNNDKNVVSGTVYDAITGEALSDVDIHILLGHLDSSENIVEKIALAEENPNPSEGIYSSRKTISTDEQGRYTCELAPGYYTFVLQKEGYITGSIHVISLADEKGNQGVLQQDATLSPELKEGEYRIVLTWGAKPSDLDSHLKGYADGLCKFHVYYGNRYYVEEGEIVAFLDRDDVTAYGPETVTLTLQVDENSRYEYYVRDYTNGGNSESLALSLSGAKVEVYFENDKVEEFTVSPNQCGTVWNVFEIINGKIKSIDVVE